MDSRIKFTILQFRRGHSLGMGKCISREKSISAGECFIIKLYLPQKYNCTHSKYIFYARHIFLYFQCQKKPCCITIMYTVYNSPKKLKSRKLISISKDWKRFLLDILEQCKYLYFLRWSNKSQSIAKILSHICSGLYFPFF